MENALDLFDNYSKEALLELLKSQIKANSKLESKANELESFNSKLESKANVQIPAILTTQFQFKVVLRQFW